MNTTNESSLRINSHQENHYRKIILMGSIVLGIIVLGAIAYQVMILKKALPGSEQALRQQYQMEQLQQAEAFFATLPARTFEITEANKKDIEKIMAIPQVTVTTEQLQTLDASLQTLQDQAFKEWKEAKNQ